MPGQCYDLHMSRIALGGLKVAAGLLLGLAIAEAVFRWRDEGAFPHVNFYEPDPELGVRLQPHASMKIRVATNPVTSLRTNSRGFRGGEWPPPAPGEILVVGDSQVVGLGVEEEDTFSAALAKKAKVQVINAGVPTYGPLEYTALVERLAAERRPAAVVYVLNLANDLFELERPNRDRHAVWDGWAVRAETAPHGVLGYPGRQWLMSQSHLVFAARAWLARGALADAELATEGTWRDIVQASTAVHPEPSQDEKVREVLGRRKALDKQLTSLSEQLGGHFSRKVISDDRTAEAAKALAPGRGDPRDIVRGRFIEEARPVDRIAYHLFMAAIGAARNDVQLEEIARSTRDEKLQQLIADRRSLRKEIAALQLPGGVEPQTPLDAMLARTRAACDRVGARLLVVALPLDVMVSAEEWKKYGRPPLDMTGTKVLVEHLAQRALAAGAVPVDPAPALAAAEPGAFLDGDLHLTPKGHGAVAEAIQTGLRAPPRPPGELALPPGRSWPPPDDAWRAEAECTVKGSTAARCETKRIGEWLRLICRDEEREEGPSLDVRSAAVVRGGHGDALVEGSSDVEILIPILEGDETEVQVRWSDHVRLLHLSWPKGAAQPAMAFGEKQREAPLPPPGYIGPHPGDVSDPLRQVSCPADQRPSGALRRCAPRCSTDADCPSGHCEPWPSGGFCARP